MLDDLDLNAIQDENAQELIRRAEPDRAVVGRSARGAGRELTLRDEINRLKGEQGKPKIKSNTPKAPSADHSSEKERRKARQRHKGSKKAAIKINREQVVEVDRAWLPADAEFKGYEDVVVQDILLKTDNVCFHKQKYYAPSTRQTYLRNCHRGMQASSGRGSKP